MGEITLKQEFIVCYHPAYPDPLKPTPNTLENAMRIADEGRGLVKSRWVADWENEYDART